MLQREQNFKTVNIFSLEKKLLQGGGVPEGIKCKIALNIFSLEKKTTLGGVVLQGAQMLKLENFLGSLVFGAHFFLGY